MCTIWNPLVVAVSVSDVTSSLRSLERNLTRSYSVLYLGLAMYAFRVQYCLTELAVTLSLSNSSTQYIGRLHISFVFLD